MWRMNDTAAHAGQALEQRYERLRQKLARIGYISQGTVLARSVATSGRSGYQWTRKVAGKTVSVALSHEQFEAMKRAVANRRELRRIVEQMEKVSRQFLFQNAADSHRRKPLSQKVLGTI